MGILHIKKIEDLAKNGNMADPRVMEEFARMHEALVEYETRGGTYR